MNVQGRSGERYVVAFLDDHSRLAKTYKLRTKDGVLDSFMRFKAWAENQMNARIERFDEEGLRKTIRVLRDDKGGEYTSSRFESFCQLHGIDREHTIRASPEQNGVAERFNRTLLQGVVTILSQSKLPHSLWPDAVDTIVHIYNRTPHSSNNARTPYELWNGFVPSISHLRAWGCEAHVHIQRDQRSKLDPHAKIVLFSWSPVFPAKFAIRVRPSYIMMTPVFRYHPFGTLMMIRTLARGSFTLPLVPLQLTNLVLIQQLLTPRL
jgi:hypothetical protein